MIIPNILLLAFVLIVIISIVWSTLRTGISPTKSSGKACRTMLELVDGYAIKGPIIDLGSGWGTLVIILARKYPEQQVIGYELSLFPWLVSIIVKHGLRLNNLTIYRQDFSLAELNHAAVLFCYLFPGGMSSLDEKLQRELLTETLIVSNTFALPSCQPEKVIRLKDIYQTPVYLYFWKSKTLLSQDVKR